MEKASSNHATKKKQNTRASILMNNTNVLTIYIFEDGKQQTKQPMLQEKTEDPS